MRLVYNNFLENEFELNVYDIITKELFLIKPLLDVLIFKFISDEIIIVRELFFDLNE